MKKRELLDSIQVSISIIITTSSLFPGAQTYCFLLCTARLRRLQPSSSHLTYKGTFTIHITIALSPSSWPSLYSASSILFPFVKRNISKDNRQDWICLRVIFLSFKSTVSEILDPKQYNFILTVSSQLRFLNYYIKVYFPYRDLSPHRPFQELIQYKQNNWLHQLKILLLF